MTDIVETASGELEIVEVASGSVEIVEIAVQGPPGVDADHSGLLNLDSDDHLQYHTDARGDARYSPLAHDHSGVYEPADAAIQSHLISTSNPHSVTVAQIGAEIAGTAAGLLASHESALDPHPGYLTADEGAAAYAPIAHDHNGMYEPSGAVTSHAAITSSVHGISEFGATLVDDTDAGTARSTLGLGTAATTAATDYAAAAHNHTGTYDPAGTASSAVSSHEGAADPHPGYALESSLGGAALLSVGTTTGTVAAGDHAHAASAITSGTIDTARLGSGTANSSTYLRGDQTWAAAAGGVAADTHAATEKTTPVDADELPLVDSAASWVLKRLTWGNLKTTLSGVFPLLAGKSGGQTLIGGTGVADKLVLQGTSGNGTSTAAALEVKVGNNGLVTGLSIDNTGIVTLNSGLNFSQVTAPTAPGLTILAVAGNVPVGLHRYLVTYVTDIGETQKGSVSQVTIEAGSQQVQMTIPVSTDSRVKSRYLYRDDNNYVFKRIAILADNTTTSYTDNNASGDTNNNIWYSPNTTNKIIVYNGTSKILVANPSVTLLGEGALASAGILVKELVAIGSGAGNKITTGTSNTCIGFYAGSGLTSGVSGCFVGSYAGGLSHNTSNNTCIGYGAGYNYTGSMSGSSNVVVGARSGGGGAGNLSLGHTASNTCVIIGMDAGFTSTATMANGIAIGYNCLLEKSNQAILGNSSITETLLRGKVGINASPGSDSLRIGYDATYYASFTVASDGTLSLTTSNNKIVLGASRTPASASATGVSGETCWDANYIYVCTAANTWKRATLSTW